MAVHPQQMPGMVCTASGSTCCDLQPRCSLPFNELSYSGTGLSKFGCDTAQHSNLIRLEISAPPFFLFLKATVLKGLVLKSCDLSLKSDIMDTLNHSSFFFQHPIGWQVVFLLGFLGVLFLFPPTDKINFFAKKRRMLLKTDMISIEKHTQNSTKNQKF